MAQQKGTRAATTVPQGGGGNIGDRADKTVIMQIWSRLVGTTSSSQTNFAQTPNTAARQYATVTPPNGDANSNASNTTNPNSAASNRKKRRPKK